MTHDHDHDHESNDDHADDLDGESESGGEEVSADEIRNHIADRLADADGAFVVLVNDIGDVDDADIDAVLDDDADEDDIFGTMNVGTATFVREDAPEEVRAFIHAVLNTEAFKEADPFLPFLAADIVAQRQGGDVDDIDLDDDGFDDINAVIAEMLDATDAEDTEDVNGHLSAMFN